MLVLNKKTGKQNFTKKDEMWFDGTRQNVVAKEILNGVLKQLGARQGIMNSYSKFNLFKVITGAGIHCGNENTIYHPEHCPLNGRIRLHQK